jgi:hypothetical protein
MQVLTAGALYFALVFAAGFVLGPIRVLWAEPRFGPRVAELMEAPIMLVVIVLAARAVLRRLAVPSAPGPRLGMGGVALALLLGAELAVVLRLRGLTIAEYLASRDPVSGSVYVAMLGIFALMPLFVARDVGDRA